GREAGRRGDRDRSLPGGGGVGPRGGLRVHLVVGGVVGGERRDSPALQRAANDGRGARCAEAAARRVHPQQGGHTTEALVEVGELVERVAVPREVPLAADVLLDGAGRQRALVAQVGAAAVEGVAVLERQVPVVRLGHR